MAEFSIDTFGRRVAERRKQWEWSPAELSRQTGVNQSTICRVEKGEMPNLSLRIACQLAKALQVSIGYLCKEG